MAFCRLCFVLMKPNALQMEYSLRKLFLHYALQLLIVNVPNTLSHCIQCIRWRNRCGDLRGYGLSERKAPRHCYAFSSLTSVAASNRMRHSEDSRLHFELNL